MKTKVFIILALLFTSLGMRAQNISYVETTKSWYYFYDQDGKKFRTVSRSSGELMGYSSTFYILKEGSSFYVTFDPKGRKLFTLSVSSVGEILSVSGDTFTSRLGSWIYTWSKEGKKISTKMASSS